METNKIYHEPCLDTLKRMPDNFIDCVITSPPYWQLRDYGYPEQWGLEPTFHEYLEHLWQMMDEIYRVLKQTGTVWINLGDTYNNSGWAGNRKNKYEDQPIVATGTKAGRGGQKGYPNKCLVLFPHRFAIGCIDRGWIVRNDIIWAKRNGMPEPVKDRFTKKHEFIFFMVKTEKYYFTLDSIKSKVKDISLNRIKYSFKSNHDSIGKIDIDKMGNRFCNVNGKNPGTVSDFWDVKTKPSLSEHFATYNDQLISRPILAGCPENGIIYDPFMGSGSTAEAALRANRQFIGSEMSAKYCQIANNRLEPYLKQKTLF